MMRQHHQLNGCEFEQTPGDSEDRGVQRATVHGVAKSRHDIGTEQKQHTYICNSRCFVYLQTQALKVNLFSNLSVFQIRLILLDSFLGLSESLKFLMKNKIQVLTFSPQSP